LRERDSGRSSAGAARFCERAPELSARAGRAGAREFMRAAAGVTSAVSPSREEPAVVLDIGVAVVSSFSP